MLPPLLSDEEHKKIVLAMLERIEWCLEISPKELPRLIDALKKEL